MKKKILVIGAGIAGSYFLSLLKSEKVVIDVVEKGSNSNIRQLSPQLIQKNRINKGLVEARHHIIGGNSTYWGGGLMYNSLKDIERILPAKYLTNNKNIAFSLLENQLKVLREFGISVNNRINDKIRSVHILNGRSRDIYSKNKKQWPLDLNIFSGAQNAKFVEIDNQPYLTFSNNECSTRLSLLNYDSIVISCGFLDTLDICKNLIFGSEQNQFQGISDHLSIRIGEISFKLAKKLSLYPPFDSPNRRESKRLLLDKGYLHVQPSKYSDSTFYGKVKNVGKKLQKGRFFPILISLLQLIRSNPLQTMFLPYHILVNHSYPWKDGDILDLMLDIETYPSEFPTIKFIDGSAFFDWRLIDQDLLNFNSALTSATTFFEQKKQYQQNKQDLNLFSFPNTLTIKQLEDIADDTYHICGGLSNYLDSNFQLQKDLLRLSSLPPIYILSTATFRRCPRGNPVLTLLSIAHHIKSLILR